MALQSFRIKFLAMRAAALDLPEKPIFRACRRVHNHPGRIPLAGQRAGSKVRCNFRVSLISQLREAEYRGSGLMSFGGGSGASAIEPWVAARFKSQTVGETTVYDLMQQK
jgi:hypothetical protein